jgi:hypothetical protein
VAIVLGADRREKEGLMGLIISVLALLSTLTSIPAFAQVKKWVDEKGVVPYEAIGPDLA